MTRRLPIAAILSALVMLNIHLKVRQSVSLPRYDPEDDTGYFRVESAFQYRYARMIARGEPIPDIDKDAQYPEGVRVGRELTMAMEYATGWTYRLMPWKTPPDFLFFVILWVSAFSSLSIVAFYWLAARLTRDPPTALAAAAVYGLSWAAMSDLVGTYGFQCFSLPLIFLSLAFFLASLDEGEERPLAHAAAAGAAMVLALLSWHVTRFYLAAFFAAGLLCTFRNDRERPRLSLGIFLAFAAAAGMAFPVLRETRFAVSPPMMLGYLWFAALFLRPLPLAGLAAALAAAPLLASRPESASYGHVYGMFLDKLRFFLMKPADPALLSREARLLWVGPFDSPEAGLLIFSLVPMLFAGAARLTREPREKDLRGRLVDALTLLCAAGTALVARLLPFFVFFFGLSAIRPPSGRRPRAALAWGLCVIALLEGLKSFAPSSRRNVFMWLSAPFVNTQSQPPVLFRNELHALQWLKAHAGPGQPVLAHYGISGPILAYTGSPVLLNPKYESAGIRAKSMEYLEALYSNEDAFYAFFRKNQAHYFLYNTGAVLDQTKDSSLYGAGRKDLRPDDAAVMFHFHPERSKRFRLVYSNPDFRVFSDRPEDKAPPYAKEPIYDIDQFDPRVLPDGSLRLDIPGVLKRIRDSRLLLFEARLRTGMGDLEGAFGAYERAFAAWPPDAETRQEAERLRR